MGEMSQNKAQDNFMAHLVDYNRHCNVIANPMV